MISATCSALPAVAEMPDVLVAFVSTDRKAGELLRPLMRIPMGDNFDIDYVVHEVGHQLGANHTFSLSNEGSGQQKEVGSGITIMGYAGITSQDVAPHSIDIFHETSIAQIQANLANKTCPITTVMTANHVPVVAPVSNFTIPISTPFALTGSATDPEGDPITYCWEQNDNSTTTGNASVASPTKLTGPNWLSFSPTASPTRLFPKLSTILAGLFVTPTLPGGDAVANIEALSSVSRTLNFRLTVRDNHPYVASSTVGQTQFTDMTVTVTNTAGPFKVTSPNTNVSWAGGSNQTITWDVANTTLPPVSTANVKISLSTDGGQTFPTVLQASTPNDGSELVTIPAGASSTARVKVEAIGNIFFDISDTNFSITGAAPLTLATAVSRKTHGAAGPFDINLPLSGSPGVECRSGGAGGDFALVITFSNTVVSGNAAVTGGTGSIAGAPTFSGNTMTVNLTGVTNAQTTTVSLADVTDSSSQVLLTTAIAIGFLVGDTSGNGSVNASDVSQTKLQSGQTLTATNFREDVTFNGSINASDVSLVKSNSGTALPVAGGRNIAPRLPKSKAAL